MAVQIPFPLPSKGFALNSKVRVNLDYIVSKFNEFNTGTATWDNVFIGTPNVASGALTFYNSSNTNYLQINAGATDANTIYTLPISLPAAPGVLMSTSAGVQSWSSSPTLTGLSVGTTGSISAGIINLSTSARFLNGTGFATAFIPSATATADLSFTWPATLGGAGDVLSVNGSGVLSWTTGSATKALDNLASVAINTALLPGTDCTKDLGSATLNWRDVFVKNNLLLQQTGAGVNFIGIQAPAAVTSHYLVLPAAQGAASTVLTNDGAGNLSWAAGIAGGANTELDNLGIVAINTALLPDTRNAYALGSATKSWLGVYAANVIISDPVTPFNSVTLLAPTIATSYSLTLPADDGTASQVLQTNGSGVLSWADHTSIAGLATTTLNNIGSTSLSASLIPSTDKTFELGDPSKIWSITHSQLIDIYGATSGYTSLAAAATTTSYTLTFPAAQGGAGETLSNNGSGVLSWTALAAAGANPTLSNLADTVTINKNLNDFSAGEITITDAHAIIFKEKLAGTDSISLRAPDSVTTSYALQLPPAVAGAGQVLTDAAGNGILSWGDPVGSGATKALNNLVSVAINTSLLPASDGTIDLGSVALRFQNIYNELTVYSTQFTAGSSGLTGQVNIYPTTESKGRLVIMAGNSLGNTDTTVINASQTGARTYTIPDAGASASFVLTGGTQTINGTKTFSDLRGTLGANLAAGGFKLTGLAVGSGNGDSLRYEQLIGVYLPLAGGTVIGSTTIQNTNALHLEGNDSTNQHTLLTLDDRNAGVNFRGWTFLAGKNIDTAYGNYSLRLYPYNTVNTGDLVLAYGGGNFRLGKGQAATVDTLTGFTEHFKIDTNGIITRPLQTSFLATMSGATNVTGDATVYTVAFATEVYDQNADYDNGTYTFTAPVTGKYLLCTNVALANLAATHALYQIQIVTSNRTYTTINSNSVIMTYAQLSLSTIADMGAGDTALVQILVSGGTKVVDIIANAAYNNFSGTLL